MKSYLRSFWNSKKRTTQDTKKNSNNELCEAAVETIRNAPIDFVDPTGGIASQAITNGNAAVAPTSILMMDLGNKENMCKLEQSSSDVNNVDCTDIIRKAGNADTFLHKLHRVYIEK
jgi:hypothetical protein